MEIKHTFIVIEGIDGVGKSTLAKNLAILLSTHHPVLLTREPGGSTLGKEIRELLQSHEKIDPRAQFLLFAADRAQHISQVIKPALQEGRIVVSDRFIDSSIAYQCYGNHLSQHMIQTINEWIIENIKPTLTIFLDMPIVAALSRVEKRGRFHSYEKADFLERTQRGFYALYQNRKDVLVLDAEQNELDILHQAYKGIIS
jgi:dTMP kinase